MDVPSDHKKLKNKQMKTKVKLLTVLFIVTFNFILVNAGPPKKIEPFITPFGEFDFTRPIFPDRSVNILEYGAKEGSEIINTKAINNAIKDISGKGGGKVIIPKGKWLTGPIVLLSNINLHLQEGAELLFSQKFSDYLPAVLTNFEGSEVYSYSPFIYAYKQENIAITGKGTLNGRGKPWWEQRGKEQSRGGNRKLMKMNENEIPVNERRFDNLNDFLPPVFFGPLYCKNILIEGVRFMYGAFWTINPSFCENIIVRDIYILTNGEYGDTPNGDGINPNSCSNVLIEYNTLDTGDDCITIKSGRNKDGRRIGMPCKNIFIRHNVGLQGHGGIVIGSEMSGGVENIYAYECRFNGTDRMLRIKTERGRGGYVKNCWFEDMSADTIEREAIRINMLYHGDRLPMELVDAGTPVIKNINFNNIRCSYSKRNIIQIRGIPEMPVSNVTFENIDLSGNKGIEISDAKSIYFNNTSAANQSGSFATISYSDSIFINNISIDGTDENEVPFIYTDVGNSGLQKLESDISGKLVTISGDSKNINFDKSVPKRKIEFLDQK